MQNQLADKRQVALVLRLTIDRHGQLLHGEVVELEGKVIGRFAEWTQVLGVMQTWLVSQGKEGRAGNRKRPPAIET